jgi:Plasmid recombination enzyme
MGYCVLHCRKGKNAEPLGNHIDRVEGKEYSYRHSDETKRSLNKSFEMTKYQKLSLNEAVTLRISDGYTGTTAIRKDAVRFVETIFSGSHDDMIKIQSDNKMFQKWIEKTISFAKNAFGEKNIVRMSLHLDENTPHFHCVSVPLIEGRLTAKKLLTRESLSKFQSDYAEEMSEFGLNRGELGSEAIHNDQTEFNANKIREAKENLLKIHSESFEMLSKLSYNILGKIHIDYYKQKLSEGNLKSAQELLAYISNHKLKSKLDKLKLEELKIKKKLNQDQSQNQKQKL